MASSIEVASWVRELTGGGPETEKCAAEIIAMSEEGQILFHGIKSVSAALRIEKEGVSPLTVEGVALSSSYWAKGNKTFAANNRNALTGYDTPFFHYAHAKNEQDHLHSMRIAHTSVGRLVANGVSPDSIHNLEADYVEITDQVPYSAISLVALDLERDWSLGPRESAQRIESEFIQHLSDSVRQSYPH